MAWEDVPQRTGGAKAALLRMALAPLASGQVKLAVTVKADLAEQLGWAAGTTLALATGTGADAGRLRLSPAPGGRRLARLGKGGAFIVRFDPGPALDGLEALSAPADWEGAGDALVATIPWDLTEARAARDAQ